MVIYILPLVKLQLQIHPPKIKFINSNIITKINISFKKLPKEKLHQEQFLIELVKIYIILKYIYLTFKTKLLKHF